MAAAAAAVTSAEVTRAVRSARVDGVDVDEGDWIGLVEGTITDTAPDMVHVVEALARRLVSADTVLVTALLGRGRGRRRARRARVAGVRRTPTVEFDVHEGGQPFHALLLGAE